MAITYTTILQNQIALRVAGVVNSSMDAGDKTYLDNTWTSGALTSGSAAKLALDRVNQMAQWFQMAGATDAPEVWEDYFVAYAALRFAIATRPERIPMLRKEAEEAREECLAAFTRKAIDFDPDATVSEAYTLTVQTLRYYIANYCVRRTPRLFVPWELVDTVMASVLNDLWNGHNWSFRRRQTEMVLVVLSPTAPTFTELATASETFGSSAVKEWTYSDEDAAGSAKLRWCDADQWTQMKAMHGTETGRPQYVRVQQTGNTKSFQFVPLPDAAYTLRGEAYIAGPGTPSSATDTTVFARFPTEFHPIIREMVLGEVLRQNGDSQGDAMWQRATDKVERLLPTYEDQGDMDIDTASRDVYGDVAAQNGCNQIGGPLA